MDCKKNRSKTSYLDPMKRSLTAMERKSDQNMTVKANSTITWFKFFFCQWLPVEGISLAVE